ncbi:PstS family phosphate ABC transporter substrate-binding protein [Kitasatospora sp. NPDC091207]|uniref:PstS family phosphate ABC transporter substrate-binding protein n=1 Tax=Kitasatospora sp. NPDC091207 TaxID=3364083 RepID=UPI0038164880
MRKTAAKLLAIAAIATSVATVAAGTAIADPTVTPAAQDIVGVGSDTTQAVLNQISTDYNAFLTASGNTTSPRLYSWDATGTSPITTKTGATSIARPNGSGAGVNALNANTSTTVDFARSSRAPQTGDLTSDIFVAFAKDAVSWAAKTGGNAPANLTTAQLKGIYECTTTNWQQIDPTLANATIKPFLPQTDSGTRSFFLKTIGGGTAVTPGTCVTSGTQENQGTDPVLNDANALVPYSVAHYIGQVYFGHAVGSDAQGVLSIRNLNSVAPVDTVNKVIDPTFATTAYSRVVYNVVRQAEWTATDAHGTALRAIFGTNGWICKNGASDVKSYGFLPLPSPGACGSTTHI